MSENLFQVKELWPKFTEPWTSEASQAAGAEQHDVAVCCVLLASKKN